MSVQSIFHVGFVVKDLDASLRFYCDGLGLELRHRQIQDNPYTCSLVGYNDAVLEIAQLRFPGAPPPPSGHVLELICYKRPPGKQADPERNTVGAGHLAFIVHDIHEMTSRLVVLGAQLVNDPVVVTEGINRGSQVVYLYDPDGLVLEFVQPASKVAAATTNDCG